jgi:hypothetical protein
MITAEIIDALGWYTRDSKESDRQMAAKLADQALSFMGLAAW